MISRLHALHIFNFKVLLHDKDKGGGKLSKVDVYIPFNQIDKGNNLVSYTVSIHNTLRYIDLVG